MPFNPDQPRDANGRWVAKGSAGAVTSAVTKGQAAALCKKLPGARKAAIAQIQAKTATAVKAKGGVKPLKAALAAKTGPAKNGPLLGTEEDDKDKKVAAKEKKQAVDKTSKKVEKVKAEISKVKDKIAAHDNAKANVAELEKAHAEAHAKTEALKEKVTAQKAKVAAPKAEQKPSETKATLDKAVKRPRVDFAAS